MNIRERVLDMLSGGEEVSGGQLAEELGVSRNAVWKVVEGLREEGCVIEAATRRGYRLVAGPDRMSEREIRRWLKTEAVGRQMKIHESLDSTNNRARALAAAGAPHGTAVMAEFQTGGRGRRGRTFFSPARSGVWISYILRPACTPEEASLITSMAAVAAARAVERVAGAPVGIKWVNDLYMNGKKFCGILSEAGMGMEAGQLDHVVVGIGVNTAVMDFPPELAQIATSVGNETGRAPDRNRLAAEIGNELEALLPQLKSGGFLEENRRRSVVLGREVLVLAGERQYPAKAEAIDERGRLVVRTAEGFSALDYGEVSLRLENGGKQ